MPLFAPPFLESLREGFDLSRWPGVLAAPGSESLRARVEQALNWAPKPVAEALRERLTSTEARDLFLGRALLWGACLAGQAGAVAREVLEDGSLRMASDDGEFLLAPLVFHMDPHPRGEPEAMQRLRRTLEQSFAGRRFAVAVRRAVQPDFDAEAVARAVHLWILAVERGEWRGRHAIYDDEKVSVELTLLDAQRVEPGHGLTFLVGPSSSLERLAVIDGHLQGIGRQHIDSGLPMVGLLVGEPRWGIARGYAAQLLYGTPDEVRAVSNAAEHQHRAAYLDEGFSLFADVQFRRLAALWWLEPAPDDPLGVVGHAHENPWAEQVQAVPHFPGSRFSRVEGQPGDEARPGRAWMRWTRRLPTTWREGPCTPT